MSKLTVSIQIANYSNKKRLLLEKEVSKDQLTLSVRGEKAEILSKLDEAYKETRKALENMNRETLRENLL